MYNTECRLVEGYDFDTYRAALYHRPAGLHAYRDVYWCGIIIPTQRATRASHSILYSIRDTMEDYIYKHKIAYAYTPYPDLDCKGYFLDYFNVMEEGHKGGTTVGSGFGFYSLERATRLFRYLYDAAIR